MKHSSKMGDWKLFGRLIVLAVVVTSVLCLSEDFTEETKDSGIHARQAWIQTDKDLKSAVSKIIRKAMPIVLKEVYNKDISTECMGVLLQLASGLKQTKNWAFKMLDSSGRFPEGFLSGTLTSLGNYDECVRIHVNETKLKLKGQYCNIQVQPPVPAWKPFTSMHGTIPELLNISTPDSVITYLASMLHNLHVVTIRIGICTPSLCSLEDINKLVQIIPEKMNVNWDFKVRHCETQQTLHFTHSQIAVLCVMGAIILLLLAGTIIDIAFASEEMEIKCFKSKIFHIAKSFSVISNVRKLSDWTGPQEKLNFVYGIIILVYFWVVISNTFMYVNYETASNIFEAFELVKSLFYEIILNRILPLQVLFFLSGLMTAYRFLKCPVENISVWKFLLKKYWRYTPPYALVLTLLIVSPTWGSGPMWYAKMNPLYNNCRDNWWYNLLYINNFMDSEQMCLDHTWVFAVYAQLHIIAIFILIPLKMRPKIGLMVNFMLAMASLVSVALTNVYYDLPPNEMIAILHIKDRMFYAEHSYYRVYTHLGMYCSGIFVAYLVYKYPNLKISKKLRWFLWIITAVGLAASFCVVHEWRSGAVPSPLIAAVYTSFSKVAEASFLAWLSVACMTGYGGAVKEFLSWRPFAFLSRLSFIAYILHVPIITMVNAFKKGHFFVNELGIFYIAMNNIVSTLIISYILYLAFEAPFLSLTQAIKKEYMSRSNSNNITPMTEKPMKFAEKSSGSSEPKVWINIIEKSRC